MRYKSKHVSVKQVATERLYVIDRFPVEHFGFSHHNHPTSNLAFTFYGRI
jgi:hypothetical protein